MAVDLEDAYNRVQFQLLMELLMQCGVSLTLTRWLAAALLERKVAIRLENWISTPQQLTMGLSQEPGSKINSSKTQALWYTLNNKAVEQAIPAVSFSGEVIERTNSLRYLGIHFNRMLTYKTQVKSRKVRCEKGLSALKAVASNGIEQRHLFLLYQSVVHSLTC